MKPSRLNFRAYSKERGMFDVGGFSLVRGLVSGKADEEGMYWREKLDDVVMMQSIGLVDKNGVEIFEGDIIKGGDNDGAELIEPPQWYECDAFTEYGYHNLGSSIDDYGAKKADRVSRVIKGCEILGNKYEHPELLTNRCLDCLFGYDHDEYGSGCTNVETCDSCYSLWEPEITAKGE